MVDPTTGQVVFSSPDKPDLSTSQKEAQALGFDLGTPEGAQGYAQWRQSLTRPPAGTTVNVPAQYPNAPQGFHYEGGPDDIRLVVTPGGPADLEQRAQAEKEQAAQAADVRQLGTVSRLTDRVLSTVSDPSWSPTLALGTRYPRCVPNPRPAGRWAMSPRASWKSCAACTAT